MGLRTHGTTAAENVGAGGVAAPAPPVPGAVLVFANRRPRCRVFRWQGLPLELGRLELSEDDAHDSLMSRKHARLELDGARFAAEDLGSRNGTFVNGERVQGRVVVEPGSIVRIGGALLTVVMDVLEYQRDGLGARAGVIRGPLLGKALDTIAHSSKAGVLTSLLITGESGSGKEIAATVFHESGPDPRAPFVAVNCATIPKELAERLLFGSRKGAFSGATDAPGHVQAAHGGTLFLDEIAELSPEVQTKLLRMIELREVVRLGATTPERVDVRICAATWRNLRGEVAAGRFRQDLYYRIGQPEIRLPPLRDRREEIPWHIQHALDGGRAQLDAEASFVEECMRRAWPGNVRELRAEVRRATAAALAQGSPRLTAADLAPEAGTRFEGPPSESRAFPADEVAEALAAERGNVLGAARRLNVHRNQIRRWLERHGVDARRFKQ